MQASSKDSATDANPQFLAQAAITAAITGAWQEAVKLNEKILTSDSINIEALNRLARAQTCTGQALKAQKTYKKVLELDPYNVIAQKNLEKLQRTVPAGVKLTNGIDQTANLVPTINLSQIFLDEPGKTKIVNLLNLAPPSTLATLNCGDQLVLNPKNHSIVITSQSGTYLGAFPDDLAHRLIAFISGGNRYEAYVKNATIKNLAIFVRETQRSAKFGNQPSFHAHSSLFDEENK